MKRIARILTATLLAAALLFPAAVFGSSSAVSMSGAKTVKAGEVITISITYRGEALGYVNGHLTYDTERLEYLSGGSSQGNAGLVQLKKYADNADGKLSFKVKFRAANAGSVSLNLETLETQNLDGDAGMGTPSSAMTVKVTGNAGSSQAAGTTETAVENSSGESETSELTTAPQEPETSETAEESSAGEQEEHGMPYKALLIAAVVIAALIVIVVIRLKKKK